MIEELTHDTVFPHWVLFLHGGQHPTRSPEPDVRRSGLSLCRDDADPASHPDVRDSARALRIKVKSADCLQVRGSHR
jgi:hypothetical protein